MAKKHVEPSDSSSNDASNHSSSHPNNNDSMNASSLNTFPQTDNQESNDLLRAILGTMQSIDKNVKKLKKIKNKSSIKPSVGHKSHDNDPLKEDLTATSEQNTTDFQGSDRQDRKQYTAEYQLGGSLRAYVELLSLIEEDNELCQLVLFRTEDTSSEDAQTQADNEQAIKLVTMIASLAQWDKVTAIWDLLAERCKARQRPANVDELYILTSAINIHNLTWRDKKAKLQSVDCPTPFNYKSHHRGNIKGETITEEWLPALVNPGATSTLNAIVYTE
ncbi:hypothetical protein [Psychrobacter celer]|uniref:hypothetical protein n=1 Tax=Psychrobacter celer TaxID=306572 RepID=UPI0018E00191|nr:hypothetical protein [Psychrobacter celer]